MKYIKTLMMPFEFCFYFWAVEMPLMRTDRGLRICGFAAGQIAWSA